MPRRRPRILKPWEYIRAVHSADRTVARSVRENGHHQDGTPAGFDPLRDRTNNIRGRMGEIAVAIETGRPWLDEFEERPGGLDVGGCNVRASQWTDLRIELDDKEVPMVACLVPNDQVLTTMTPEVIMLGWAWPSEVREKGRPDNRWGRLKHYFDESQLHDLGALP